MLNARFLLLPVAIASLSACSWVKVSEKAVEVTVAMKPEVVSHCERLGTTTANSLSKVGFINRNDKKVAEELIILAKNTAADMGGNAILADGGIVDGKQTFIVYHCP